MTDSQYSSQPASQGRGPGEPGGLGELGQRVQALTEPVAKLRPYQGGTAALPTHGPVESGKNGKGGDAGRERGRGAGREGGSTPDGDPGGDLWGGRPGGRGAAQAGLGPYVSETGLAAARGNPIQPASDPFAAYAREVPSGELGEDSKLALDEDINGAKSGLQKALSAVRAALPVVQKLLPLLEGNVAQVLNALMTPHPGHQAPPVKVNLEPVERGLAEVRTSNRELRTQVQEQGVGLKRVEDQLERVREATDRNTLEQQELVEDMRSVGSRMNVLVILGLILIVISLGVNVFFLVELQHILR